MNCVWFWGGLAQFSRGARGFRDLFESSGMFGGGGVDARPRMTSRRPRRRHERAFLVLHQFTIFHCHFDICGAIAVRSPPFPPPPARRALARTRAQQITDDPDSRRSGSTNSKQVPSGTVTFLLSHGRAAGLLRCFPTKSKLFSTVTGPEEDGGRFSPPASRLRSPSVETTIEFRSSCGRHQLVKLIAIFARGFGYWGGACGGIGENSPLRNSLRKVRWRCIELFCPNCSWRPQRELFKNSLCFSAFCI